LSALFTGFDRDALPFALPFGPVAGVEADDGALREQRHNLGGAEFDCFFNDPVHRGAFGYGDREDQSGWGWRQETDGAEAHAGFFFVEAANFAYGGSPLTVNDLDAVPDGAAKDGGDVMRLAWVEGDFGGVCGPPVFRYVKSHGDGLGEISSGVYLESFGEAKEESRKNHLRMKRLG
jgi:hypothetical protein